MKEKNMEKFENVTEIGVVNEDKKLIMRLMSEVIEVQKGAMSRAVFFGKNSPIDDLLRDTMRATIDALLHNRCGIKRLSDLAENTEGLSVLAEWNRVLDESERSNKRLLEFLADKIEDTEKSAVF